MADTPIKPEDDTTWRTLRGADGFKGLLPGEGRVDLDRALRKEVLKYGEFAQVCIDARRGVGCNLDHGRPVISINQLLSPRPENKYPLPSRPPPVTDSGADDSPSAPYAAAAAAGGGGGGVADPVDAPVAADGKRGLSQEKKSETVRDTSLHGYQTVRPEGDLYIAWKGEHPRPFGERMLSRLNEWLFARPDDDLELVKPLDRSGARWMGYTALGPCASSIDGDQDLVIAFGDSDELADLYAKTNWLEPPETDLPRRYIRGVKVHFGLWSIWAPNVTYKQFDRQGLSLNSLRDVFVSLPPDLWGSVRSVTFTGHGVGGALALLAAWSTSIWLSSIIPNWDSLSRTVYTFNAPPVGNKAFAEDLEAMRIAVLNVVNVRDPFRLHLGRGLRHGSSLWLCKFRRAVERQIVALACMLLPQTPADGSRSLWAARFVRKYFPHWPVTDRSRPHRGYSNAGVTLGFDSAKLRMLRRLWSFREEDWEVTHSLEVLLYLISQQFASPESLPFPRDVALMNKHGNCLHEDLAAILSVPSYWWCPVPLSEAQLGKWGRLSFKGEHGAELKEEPEGRFEPSSDTNKVTVKEAAAGGGAAEGDYMKKMQ